MTLTSCSKQDEVTQVKSIEPNTTQLLSELQFVNDNLLAHKVVSRSGALGCIAIAAGDIRGAARGAEIGFKFGAFFGPNGAAAGAVSCAIICGIGGSYLAYKAVTPKRDDMFKYRDILSDPKLLYEVKYTLEFNRKKKPDRDGIIGIPMSRAIHSIGDDRITPKLDLPIDFSYCRTVGIEHNLVMEELFAGNFIDKLQTGNENGTENKEYNLFSSAEFKEEYLRVLDGIGTMYSNGDEGQLIENIKNLDDSTIENKILKLFLDIYLNYPSNLEDVDYLVNTYIEKIELSKSLTAAEKQSIYGAFAVAAYSPRFWMSKIE